MWKMSERALAFCFSFLLLSALAFQSLTVVRGTAEEEETEYYITSTVKYSNQGSKVWNFIEREEDRTIGLFMNNSWQTVYLENSTKLIETTGNDTEGNRVAVLQFPNTSLAPEENISYAVTYNVVSKPRTFSTINETASGGLEEIPVSLKEKYARAEGPWLVNDTELRSLAHNITGNESNVLTVVKNFVAWITQNIGYETHETPLYPNETATLRKGDCDDQAILLITLSRIVGIPAFLQIGAIYSSRLPLTNQSYWEDARGRAHVEVVQKRIGWHGWAIVYIPPWGWLPVDLTYVFGGVHTLRNNPLNAITNAAVTSQITVQYLNISQTDYVASSRESMRFLITNGFYVYMEDEMIEVAHQKDMFGEGLEWVVPAVLLAAAALVLSSSFVIATRWKRKEERPTEERPEDKPTPATEL